MQCVECKNANFRGTAIGGATHTVLANVCTYFTDGGPTDLELAEGGFHAPGPTHAWLLFLPSS
jgi:hypothetical protein